MARKTKQQALETRQHILDAALREFSERGVSATSLTDIAVAAGVTRGAIYWHFKNKISLFTEIWGISDTKVANLENAYQLQFPDNPLRVLREILVYILCSTVDDLHNRALMEIVFHKCEFVGEMAPLLKARKAFCLDANGRIDLLLRRCISLQQLPENLDLSRAAVMLRAYITGLMENWLFMPESFDLKADAPRLIDNLITMLQLSAQCTDGTNNNSCQ